MFYCGLPIIGATEKEFKSLDNDSALRLDMGPTRILERCAKVLAPVLHMLIVELSACGKCPALWMIHWVVPLLKIQSVYDAVNYMGIHVISQNSKVIKRVIA